MRVTISRLDAKFSRYIRWVRDSGRCQRCLTKYEEGSSGLHCSHFHGRSKKSVRFDPDNCMALCFGCHQHFTAFPIEHMEFMLKRLGKKRFDELSVRAYDAKRPDYKLLEIWLGRMLGEAKGGEVFGKRG